MGSNHRYDRNKIRHRPGKPVCIFSGIIALMAVVASVWLYNEYKLRKSIEAANEKNNVYTTGAAETITPEEMNEQLKAAGMTMNEDGTVGLEGVDMP